MEIWLLDQTNLEVDKISVQCFNCQKPCHFAGECNANKKEPQLARQEFDDESTLLVMNTEEECIIKKWQIASVV